MKFDADGQPAGDRWYLRGDDDREANPSQVDVAMRDNGDFLVMWSSYLYEPKLFGRVVSKDGRLKSQSTLFKAGMAPQVAARKNGEFIVASKGYAYSPYNSNFRLSTQRLKPNASAVPGEFELTRGDGGGRYRVTELATLDEERFLVVWGDEETGKLLGQRFTAPCVAEEQTLCLGKEERFQVRVEWTDFMGLSGLAERIPANVEDSGLLYFFDAENWEMLVKVIDGCGSNGHYWVFAAATTNVAYTLTVTDTVAGETRTWTNPLGTISPAVTDTTAFATCP